MEAVMSKYLQWVLAHGRRQMLLAAGVATLALTAVFALLQGVSKADNAACTAQERQGALAEDQRLVL